MGERRLLAFTETLIFTEDLLRIASDDTLFAIQNALLENPLMGDVIREPVGLEKAGSAIQNEGAARAAALDLFMSIWLAVTAFTSSRSTVKRTRLI